MTNPIATSTIAAQAFRAMQLSAISSFADDTPQAVAAAEQYPIALGMCLEEQDWSFARRLVKLPEAVLPDGTEPDPDLSFTYQLPGDCVKLRLVVGKSVRWRQDENTIFANQSGGLLIRYTRKTTNESSLPAQFQTAVAYHLAVLLAPAYVGSRTKRRELVQDGVDALALAKRNDARSASQDSWDGAAHSDWASEAVR